MPENSLKVNPKIIDAVAQTNSAVLGKAEAFGKAAAFEQVSHSMALAVQDSVDHLRNVSVLSTTAIGIGLAFIAAEASQPAPNALVIAAAENLMTQAETRITNAAKNMATVGKDAAAILAEFLPA